MNPTKKPMPLTFVNGIKDRINAEPDFQRPPVWGTAQKQMLIDSILRNYDVPKFYWRQTATKPDKYDVVDGQQRLRTIWAFFAGEFKLPKDNDPIEGMDIAGCHYTTLPDELRLRFDIYSLDVVILQDTDEEEVREMFLRLQNGTSLKSQEKRNAYSGKMRDFVREKSKHPFFEKVGFSNARFTYDLVAAQLICLELAGGPANVKNADLNKMYEKNTTFDAGCAEAKAVMRVLNFLNDIFLEKTPELQRYNIISLYCLISELSKQYVIDEVKPLIYDWFIGFEQTRIREEQKPSDEADAEWYAYKEKISHSTDSSESIRVRMEFMLKHLLEQYPNLSRKDNQRGFTYLQKLVVFRRDGGTCRLKIKCSGEKLTWDAWHCDHVLPWSKGGKTTVQNGQISCPACNMSKGANEEAA